MPKRCALGCPPSNIIIHQFPNPKRFPDTFKAWVKIVGGNEDPESMEFYQKKIICDKHFTDKDRNRNKRLNCLAVPSLFLPSQQLNIVTPAEVTITPRCMNLDIAHSSTSSKHIDTPLECTVSSGNIHLDIPHSSDYPRVKSTVAPGDSHFDICHLSTSSLLGRQQLVNFEHNYCTQELKKTNVRHLKRVPLQLFTTKNIYLPRMVGRKFPKEVKYLHRKIQKMHLRIKNLKSRLGNYERICDDRAFQRVTKDMTSSAKLFTNMQFRQTRKKPSGRRFTMDEKILSLSIFKKSPKCYNHLSKCFALPSPKTLKSLLADVKINYGLNEIVFEKIKVVAKEMNEEDRLCSLIFDEMSISPQIHYDNSRDQFKGFAYFGTNKIADHVLVFMIKGVKANFKQPIAYYYTNSLNKFELKNTIFIEVIKRVQATGLIILSTICDQGTANVGAINELIQNTKEDFSKKGKVWRHNCFTVNDKQIIPLFDVPHLLKCLRNNLLTKNLKYIDTSDNNKEKIVKWDYFQQVYAADKCLGELKLLNKLTEEHLNPEKIKKMRVKTAAQVFSHSVAVVTEHLSARGMVPEECRQLIPFVSLVDKLFDSLNSSTYYIPNGKLYKGCVRRTSPHHELWKTAIKTLNSMKFIHKKKTGDKIRLVESTAPTIKKFIKTIEGMQVLWKILSQKYSFDSMLTRNMNQDPLENFFGSIRSYGARNNAPNCIAFEGAFKSLLLNNFNSPHNIKSNCEEDNNTCLQNLKFFLKTKHGSSVPENDPGCTSSLNVINLSDDMLLDNNILDLGKKNYVCGWVLTKCLKNVIKGCKDCKRELITTEDNSNNEFIRAKEYNKKKKWLVYPSPECEKLFGEIQHLTVSALKNNISKENIKSEIILIVDTLVYFPSTCSLHYEKLKKYFVDLSIKVIIYSWCREINRILVGKIKYNGDDDEIKIIAQQYYEKHKHNKVKK